jgi:hypothetical protein
VSDSAGRYRLGAVPPGPQHLSVKRIGYSPRTIHALVPGQGELEIDLSLHPVPLQLPTIVVRSTVAVRGLDQGDSTPYPDRGISAAALRNHPLLAEPDGFLALSGGEIAMDPEAPSGVHVRGGASDQTAYLRRDHPYPRRSTAWWRYSLPRGPGPVPTWRCPTLRRRGPESRWRRETD